QLERDVRDPPDFFATVDFGIERLLVVATARRAEIDSAEQFPHDHEIYAAHRIAPQRRTVDESFENRHRAEVRVIAEQLAQIEQTVLALLAGRQMIVLRIT